MDDRCIGVRFPVWARDFSLLHNVQVGTETHPASNEIGTMDFSLRVKRPESVADHLPPFTAELKNGGAISPLPHMYL
jgi:hypothetical protein